MKTKGFASSISMLHDQRHNHEPDSAVSLDRLFGTVVEGGYCVGCGACSLGLRNGPVRIARDHRGRYRAERTTSGSAESGLPLSRLCPFSDESTSEDELAGALYAEHCRHHPAIGYHLAAYVGFVAEAAYRVSGSSGGFVSWLACALLESHAVEHVVHVVSTSGRPGRHSLFAYAISSSSDAVRAGAKSRYYPVEMSEVLAIIRDRPGRYAVVGLPCFIKAVRLLQREAPIWRERIEFCIALVCGHLKSAAFSEFIALQCGVPPEQLSDIDFRVKLPDRPASRYAVKVTGGVGDQESTRTVPVDELYATDWGLGLFKYQACDYCDDVVGETADISIGDAWLPQYIHDPQGTNVIVVRNSQLQQLIEGARNEGRLALSDVTPDEVMDSQAGGFRHRRDGLRYRLYLADRSKKWRPPKRVSASRWHISAHYRRVIEFRLALAQVSHEAWAAGVHNAQLDEFRKIMTPYIERYRSECARGLSHTSWLGRLLGSGRIRGLLARCAHWLRLGRRDP